jgi:anti-sigma regulatory factor (Ser/Thr protein kinase)
VGDVSGRGIDAATIMGRQRSVFRAYAFECTSPAQILRRMLRHTEEDEMVTVACVSVDLYTGDLAYSCAGHPPPLLLDHAAHEPRWLDAPGAPPIGVAKPSDIVEGHVQLHGGATLALYTDGLVERRGASIDAGIAVLGTVIARDPAATPEQILARISEIIGAPDDDVALVVATIDPARASFEVELDADPALVATLRRRLRSWLELRGVVEEDGADVVLAVSEACNNAIEHAYRDSEGTLTVRVTLDGVQLRAEITDDGTWREQSSREDRGHGLALMRALMYSVNIQRDKTGTRVCLERDITIARDAVDELSSAVIDHRSA